MTYQITIRMPDSQNITRRCAAMRALESKCQKAMVVSFCEAHDYDPDRVSVECHNKGVGPVTRVTWAVAVEVALKLARS